MYKLKNKIKEIYKNIDKSHIITDFINISKKCRF